MKSAISITREREAFLSRPIGDLGHPEARAFSDEVVRKLRHRLGVDPVIVAHDPYPDSASTQRALASGAALLAVQDHHADVAACLAENGRASRAIGVAFDGTGCGLADEAWGGEILVFDLVSFERRGRVRPIALPGGQAAFHEPCGLAAAALLDAGVPVEMLADVPAKRLDAVRTMIEIAVGTPRRRHRVRSEREAAIELEALAASADRSAGPFPYRIVGRGHFIVDLRPAVRALVKALESEPIEAIAWRFHATLACAMGDGCRRVRSEGGPSVVALSGGGFRNRLLVEETKRRLESDGFEVLLHRSAPSKDRGIASG